MYLNHTERRNTNPNPNLNEVSSIMPAREKPRQPPNPAYSSVFRNNMPELNNLANVHLELINNNNFELYVSFDNRPLPPNELIANNGGPLELLRGVDDDDSNGDKPANRSRNERFRTKRSSIGDGSLASLRSNDEPSFSDKNDLRSDPKGSTSKLFSPAFPNGKRYKPNYGLQEPLLYSGSRFVGFQKSSGGAKPNCCCGVEVIIQHCDLENFFICGHLKINGECSRDPSFGLRSAISRESEF